MLYLKIDELRESMNCISTQLVKSAAYMARGLLRQQRPIRQQVRFLVVHEYLTIGVMQGIGIKTPKTYFADAPYQAEFGFEVKINNRT
jgi:hypothetical protein